MIVVLEALASFCYPYVRTLLRGVDLSLGLLTWVTNSAFFLMVKAVSPSPHAVGSMFGLALTATGIGEALGPVLSS